MSDHRWQGYTHSELFALIHQGPGPDASTASIRRWSELSRSLEDISSELMAAINAARADWQGEAAERARDGLHPLGEWAEQAGAAAERMRSCAEQQAGLVGRARAEMPPPVPVTAEEPSLAESFVTHLFGGQTDYELQEAASDAAEQRAFEVMRAYQDASETNTSSLAVFASPPQVVVDTPPPNPRGTGTLGRQDVTITWSGSTPPVGRTGGRGDRNRTTGAGGRRSLLGSTGRAAGDGRTRSAPGSERRERRDEETAVDRSVTEELDEGGFFADHRTPVRPVIGGEPG